MTRTGKNPASPPKTDPSAQLPLNAGEVGAPDHQSKSGDTSNPSPLSEEDKEIEALVEKMIANRRRRMKRR